MNNEKPYRQYYDQGHTAGIAGEPVERCPYQRRAAQRVDERLETMARRMAWLEGHADGISKQRQAIACGRVERHKPKRAPKAAIAPVDPGRVVRATVQRRYQRRAQRSAGGPERYVDRRLRQIASDEE